MASYSVNLTPIYLYMVEYSQVHGFLHLSSVRIYVMHVFAEDRGQLPDCSRYAYVNEEV